MVILRILQQLFWVSSTLLVFLYVRHVIIIFCYLCVAVYLLKCEEGQGIVVILYDYLCDFLRCYPCPAPNFKSYC